MRLLVTLALIVISGTSMADMVFMRESDMQKNIMLKDNKGVTTQITSGDLMHFA